MIYLHGEASQIMSLLVLKQMYVIIFQQVYLYDHNRETTYKYKQKKYNQTYPDKSFKEVTDYNFIQKIKLFSARGRNSQPNEHSLNGHT